MANFSSKINNKYPISSAENLKSSYDWILSSLHSIPELSITGINLETIFNVGNICCTCYSIDEFTEYAYGFDKFSLTRFNLQMHSENNPVVFISITSYAGMSVSTDSKKLLLEVVRALGGSADAAAPVPANSAASTGPGGKLAAIAQNLRTNGLWYLLSAAAGAAAMYFALLF